MDSSPESFHYSFKIVLIGDSGVGKSCLSSRFITNQFLSSPSTTVAAEYYVRTIEVDGKRVKLHIWDTAGHERFRAVMPNYYRYSDGVVMVYDCTDKNSFNYIETYLQDVERYAAGAERMLVANKSDVHSQETFRNERGDQVEWHVDSSEGKNLAHRLRIPFFETSAKTGENVENMFISLVTSIKRKYDAAHQGDDQNTHPFNLEESFVTPYPRKCC